jgi:phosphatidylglycerol:prolipoprotein diacylglycerol transferase
VYPVLFRIGSFEITSFGVLVAIAALVGVRLFDRELKRDGLTPDAVNAAIGGVIGGLVGAKLVWAIEFSGQAAITDLLFSRGGVSWFGGLIGGVATGVWLLRRYGVAVVRGLAAATPALATGHAIGRIGCFLVGDDYGKPTDLPWGVAFPEGLPPTILPVHPTQLYEALLLAPLAWLLIHWRRTGVPDAAVLGRYLVAAGAIRFGIEFIRINARLVAGLTLAQLISLALAIAGGMLLIRHRQRRRDRALG